MSAVPRLAGRLRSLSPRERFLLALCAGAVIAFAGVRFGVFPALDAYRHARAAIPQRRALLARYGEVAGGKEKAEASLSAARARVARLEAGLLRGDSPSAAGAALQDLLRPLVARPETRLTSIRTQSPVRKGPFSEVAVQVDLVTTTEGLAHFLAGVSREKRFLRVKRLTVNSPLFVAALANRPDQLTVSVVVAGLSSATVKEGSTGGGE